MRPVGAAAADAASRSRCTAALQGTALLLEARSNQACYGLAKGYWFKTLFSFRGRAIPWIQLAM